jgi:putative ABC transport system permease protein
MTFVLRVAGERAGVLRAVRHAVSEIAPEQAIAEMQTVDEYAGKELQWRRYYAILLGTFAGIATLLAGIGIYGVVAYSVQQRTREFGIRVALGASGRDIVLMAMREAVLMLAIGVVCGLAGAAFLTRFIASQLWGVSATDPATFAAVVSLLAGIALAASWFPARRALRADPGVALRYE